jgi:hypothetical protein
MLADGSAILAQLDAVGIGKDLDRAADRARRYRVFVVVEAHQAGLEIEAGTAWKPSKRPA